MSIKDSILKNTGKISYEEFTERINEDDEILSKTIEAEARLLDAFAKMVNSVQGLKWMLRPTMGVPYGSEDMDSMKDFMKSKIALQATRERLQRIVSEKMPILHRVIEDVLGPSEKEVEARAEMRPPQEQEEEEED